MTYMTTNKYNTATMIANRGQVSDLSNYLDDGGAGFTVTAMDDPAEFDCRYVIGFDDLAAAIKGIEAAKARAQRIDYKNGGNSQTRRSISSSFAAIKRAVNKAAA